MWTLQFLVTIFAYHNNVQYISTKEYIAVTYAHETLHALIGYFNVTDPDKGKELFPIFYEWPSYEDGQHLTMANRYVDLMANVVLQINPNMPSIDAKCLAWNGLQGTRVYDIQRSNYDSVNGADAWDIKMTEVNQRERNGTSIVGTRCPPQNL